MIASLPDMGNVAGIGLDYLIKKLDAKLYAEIYAYWPPFVTYNNGIIDYSQISYKFYSVKEHNLIIFTGEFNPSDPRRLYDLCYEVLKMADSLNIKMLYSIGAVLKEVIGLEKKVYGAVNNPELLVKLKEYDIEIISDEGRITGFNGLILGLAKEYNIDAMCLLGEIDNPNVIQPKTSKAILDKLLKILKIDSVNTSELDEEEKRKKFMEQQMEYFDDVMRQNELPGIG